MKWFKHYSDAIDDPFIQELMDEFGHFGYVGWFGLIEIIAKESGAELTGKVSVSPTYVRRKLRSSWTKVELLLTFCQTFGKLSFTFSGKNLQIEIPKMLELRDNYTKDLQASGKKPSKHKEARIKNKEKEIEKEEHIGGIQQQQKTLNDIKDTVDQVQEAYPKFNPYQYIQRRFNKEGHVRPVEVWEFLFGRLLEEHRKGVEIKSIFAWCDKVLSIEAGNIEAGISEREHEEIKAGFENILDGMDVSNLVDDM
jgi:hypothetical protein